MGPIRTPALTKPGFRRDVRLFLASLVGLLVFMIVVLVLALGRTASFAAEMATRESMLAADAAAESFSRAEGDPLADAETRLLYVRTRFDIAAAQFRSSDGRITASGETNGLLPMARQIRGGTLTIYYDATRLQNTRREFLLIGTICVAAALACAALLFFYLPKITRPIELMLDQAEKVAERGDRQDEGRYLVETFRHTIAMLKEQEHELRRLHTLQKSRADDLERVTAALTRSLTSGFLALDREGKIVDLNGAAREIIRPTADALQGATVEQAFGESEFARLLAGSFAGRRPLSRAEAEAVVGGEARLIGLTTVPLVTEEQEFLGMLALFTDLTQFRQLEGRVRDLQNLADLGEIAAGIAHEFRNSLSTVLGYLRLSRRASTPEAQVDAIGKAEREATSLSGAVDRLLSFARPMKIDAHPVDLLEVATAVADRLLVAGGIPIDCSGEPAIVQGDRILLERAVENVMRNATDSVARMGAAAEGRVTVRVVAEPAPAIIVDDTGVGVDPAEVPTLFLPFRSSTPGGYGLGLPLARKIVLLHGGELRLTGEPGRGARAVLEFGSEITELAQTPRAM